MRIKYRYLAPAGDDGEGGDGAQRRPTPAELNAQRNNERLARMAEINDEVDGRRAQELQDVSGEKLKGRFQDGEFDDTPEARERRELEADAEAEQALRDQEERAEESEEDEARARAVRLQMEGGEEGEGEAARTRETTVETGDQAGDEKVVNGVRYYLTIVNGAERWLTLAQLRQEASKTAAADEALQRANDALQQASHAALSPKEVPAELDETELENVFLSAAMGDQEAVRKLVSVIKSRPSAATPADVSRQVSQQIATQRAIEAAENAQQDLLSNDNLAPTFRMRLSEFARQRPTMKIVDAYKAVGDQMRKDFAPMLGQGRDRVRSKEERKRELVNPPQAAARRVERQEDDREVPVSSVIDQIAKGRGQDRAIRQSGRGS